MKKIVIYIVLSFFIISCATITNSTVDKYHFVNNKRSIDREEGYFYMQSDILDVINDAYDLENNPQQIQMGYGILELLKKIISSLPRFENYVEENDALYLEKEVDNILKGAYQDKNSVVLDIYRTYICIIFEDIINHKNDEEYCNILADEIAAFVVDSKMFDHDYYYVNDISEGELLFWKAIMDIKKRRINRTSSLSVVNVDGSIAFYEKYKFSNYIELIGYNK